ncbi:MAG: penicillin-binding transpeptidase domain-containing protein, partial [Desulfotomaculaceae bacterium]
MEIKTKYMLATVVLVFIVLLVKIIFLQFVHTEQFRTLARNNYIRIVPVFAPRGEIFDRSGEKMVTNRPIYTVSINDINFKGTTYSVVLERVGADSVQMAEQMARVLVRDPEYLRQTGGNIKVDGDPAENTRLIEEKIKENVRNQKTELENGQPLELAVVYDPAVAAALSGQQWDAYGIRVEKQTDMLSQLVAMLFPKGVFEEESNYAVERSIRDEIRGKKAYESVLVAEDVPLETVVELRERQLELPGVVVDIQPTRDYPHDQLMSHALGYVQNIKPEQYEQHKDEGYLMNDLYGQNGLELILESYLRGENGARQVEVDTYNRPVRDLGMKQPVPGNDLVLTVDLEVQKAAEKALAEGAQRARNAGHLNANAGAAVVMDVNTGAVLAMASYPSYNPGVFANLTTPKWQELQESGALINRAMSLYPPGSTFKMVTAAAILENNVVDPSYRMPDPGYFMLGRRYNDWKPGGHGSVDMLAAIQFSCDTYFWQYGYLAGVEAIAHYAREFGLGQLTGIGLPGE